MVQCTGDAVDALRAIRRDRGFPDSVGFRIGAVANGSGHSLRVEFSPGPAAGDRVSEQHGETVYVSEELADSGDLTLDVVSRADADGNEQPRLVLRRIAT
jgi:hypothetical protein